VCSVWKPSYILEMELGRPHDTWTHPDGRTVRLRPMEARLLEYLRARGGQIVGVDELLRNVWEYNGAVRSRTVYTTVNRLRAAIERDPHRPRWIVTVPGGGFRWMGDVNAGAHDLVRSTLPTQLDSFVDRTEVATTRALLGAGHRLVTLSGLGGMGKTRIALRVAEEMTHAFVGGIDLVDLTSCIDEESLFRRIATDLGVQIPVLDDAATALRGALAMRVGALILLDNAEQVSGSVAVLLRNALRDPSGASLVVTSRTPLGVRGEKVVPVGPLSVESPIGGGISPAAALFRDRVSTAGVRLDPVDAEAIVAQLDGIPLAIEFAAARARTLPAEELRRRLAAGIPLTRPTDSDVRHPSLDAALEQTWADLGVALQEGVGCLTVLGGRFPFALADAVIPADHPVADLLDGLVLHGMLQFDGSHYRLLTPVADFVRRRMPDVRDAAWERLDGHLAKLPLKNIWERPLSSRAALDDAAPYLPAAWVRAWRRGRTSDARALLQRTFVVHRVLGQAEADAALADEVIATAEPSEHAQLVLERANLYTSARVRQLGEAIDWAFEAIDPWTEAYARADRGFATGFADAGDVQALTPQESTPAPLAIFLAIARYYHHADRGIGSAEERLSEIEAAAALAQFAVDPDLAVRYHLLLARAHALEQSGRYSEAVSTIEELESWRSRIGEAVARFGGAWARIMLLCIAGRLDRAERLVDEFSREARRSGSAVCMARVARAAARVKAERGEAHAALLLLQEAVRAFADNGIDTERGATLRDRASIELHFGRVDLARATLARAEAIRLGRLHAFSCAVLSLECDLSEAVESVDERRVLDLAARAATRGARARSVALALHAWWLAGNGNPTGARTTLGEAWAALGPAQGLPREAIVRIERVVETLAPPRSIRGTGRLAREARST
jgi:DNA-binding winged helix-turn-helix (wHTH) protein/tetratricopeptide (TPR) repeat protein